MDRWSERSIRYRAVWTGRGQGVATDGVSWFVTQNDARPGISRYSADFSTLEARLDIPRTTAGHVGAVAIHEDSVYIALEGPELAAICTKDLTDMSLVAVDRPLERDDKRHLAWCAINPANGLLYTCDWNDATTLNAYDPASGERRADEDVTLSDSVHRSQGGVFSDCGAVYLASDEKLTFVEQIKVWLGRPVEREIEPGIHGFDAATGARLGYVRVPTRPHFPHFEEIEGLGIGPMTVTGAEAHVHLSVLDKNHSWIRDDVHLKSFVVPHPDQI